MMDGCAALLFLAIDRKNTAHAHECLCRCLRLSIYASIYLSIFLSFFLSFFPSLFLFVCEGDKARSKNLTRDPNQAGNASAPLEVATIF